MRDVPHTREHPRQSFWTPALKLEYNAVTWHHIRSICVKVPRGMTRVAKLGLGWHRVNLRAIYTPLLPGAYLAHYL